MRRFNVPSYNCRAGDVVPRRHNDRIRRLQKSKQWFEIAVGDESGGAFESGHGASSKQTKNVRVYRRKYGKIAEPQNHFPTVKLSYESCITLARPFTSEALVHTQESTFSYVMQWLLQMVLLVDRLKPSSPM